MIKPDLFNKTVNTLVDAFFDGTLEKGNCSACAVGNICGDSAWSLKFVTAPLEYSGGYTQLVADENEIVYTHTILGRVIVSLDDPRAHGSILNHAKRAEEVIENSGYTQEQLQRIEFAFETHGVDPKEDKEGYNSIESQFDGLMAVMDVLFDIHDVKEEDIPGIRAKFKAHPELVEA